VIKIELEPFSYITILAVDSKILKLLWHKILKWWGGASLISDMVGKITLYSGTSV
jgi:hypothetical protein